MNNLMTEQRKTSVRRHERRTIVWNAIRRTAIAAGLLALLLPSSTAYAVSGYLSNFETAYPAALGSRIDSCTLCHTSVPTRNSYGTAWANAGRSFSAALAALDSDADTFSNGAEIAALTFPGNNLDKPVAPPADTVAPVVSFTLPTTATTLSVNVTSFSATDNVGVTGYQLTEAAVKPLASAAGWSATAPASFTFPAAGWRTLSAWAKDAAGNVS